MDEYRVIVTPQAQTQIIGILDYITFKLQNPIAANQVLRLSEEEIASLSQMPRRIPLTEAEPWHSRGVHKMVVGNYLIYFIVDDDKQSVSVLAVILARRDQNMALQESIW